MKINLRQVIGGVPGLFEEDYERESFLTSVVKDVAEAATGVIDTFKDESENKAEATKFPSTGSLEFNKKEAEAQEKLKQKEEADRKRAYYQAFEQDRLRAKEAKDRMLREEEINDITANISTEEKNILLHYQASYKDRSIYQKAELRRKIIEQRRKAEEKQKEASIPTPAKQPSALEGAFEGRSGTTGSGTANLSAHATG